MESYCRDDYIVSEAPGSQPFNSRGFDLELIDWTLIRVAGVIIIQEMSPRCYM